MVNFKKPIVCPQATVTRLNGLPIVDYFNVDDQAILPELIDFQAQVKIAGNLFTEPNANPTALQQLNADAIVRLGNERITADSTIIFKGNLLSDHITMELDTSNLVRKSTSLDTLFATGMDTVRKHFQNTLSLTHNIIVANSDANNITIQSFNEFPSLSSQLNSIVELQADPEHSTRSVVIFESNFQAKVLQIINSNLIENLPAPNNTVTSQSYDINKIFYQISNARDSRIQSLMINGAIQFLPDVNQETASLEKSIQIDTLNGIDLNQYIPLIVVNDNQQHKSIEIGGTKTFISDLSVTHAHTVEFNKRIETRDWFENALRAQRTQTNDLPQIIESTGWQFVDITSDNLQTTHFVNGVEFVARENNASKGIIFVNDNPESVITIASDISLSSPAKIAANSELKSTELRPCDLSALIPQTINLLQSDWYQLNILGNVKLLSSRNTDITSNRCNDIDCFFRMAISSRSDESVNVNIELNLIDIREKFSFSQITSISSPTQGAQDNGTLINNINPIKLFNDAVTRTNYGDVDQSQMILTTFSSQKELIADEIIFSGTDVISSGNFSVQLINTVNINKLNEILFNRSTSNEINILSEQNLLFLNEPQANSTIIRDNQTIDGIFVADIFFVYSAHAQSSIMLQNHINEFGAYSNANAIFVDENIHVNFVNGMSLQYFIENRVKTLTIAQPFLNKQQIIDGFFTFEHLVLIGNEIRIDQINDAICNEIVLKQSADKQEITGYKQIGGQYSVLRVEKPFHVWKINNAELVSMFAKTIQLNHKQLLDRLIIRNPYQLRAHREAVVRRYFNDVTLL